jgi:hypothetical protein
MYHPWSSSPIYIFDVVISAPGPDLGMCRCDSMLAVWISDRLEVRLTTLKCVARLDWTFLRGTDSASYDKFSMSLPEKPSVRVARASKSLSVRPLTGRAGPAGPNSWRRAASMGRGCVLYSLLEPASHGRVKGQGSRVQGRLGAASTRTPSLSQDKPSICTRNSVVMPRQPNSPSRLAERGPIGSGNSDSAHPCQGRDRASQVPCSRRIQVARKSLLVALTSRCPMAAKAAASGIKTPKNCVIAVLGRVLRVLSSRSGCHLPMIL